MTWPTHPMVQKPCEVCGDMMECTPMRKVCTKCRRKREAENKRQRREKFKKSG